MNNPFVAADWEGAKCPHCKGQKTQMIATGAQPGDAEPLMEPYRCMTCNGTGRVPYNLKGLKWKPELCTGMVGVVKSTGVIGVTREDGKNIAKETWYKFHTPSGESPAGPASSPSWTLRPLLPSPDEINAQPNPREVAIAALERAGGEVHSVEYVRFNLVPGIEDQRCEIQVWYGENKVEVWMPCSFDDPDLAQYAVDCFKVLKEWADKIEWGKQ